jgi:transcriptional regulator with XRE-family HTH domain
MNKSIYTKRQKRLRALLREARKNAGMTQDQLDRRLGAYKTFVSKYEKGDRRLDVVEFIAVAEVLGVEPEEVIAAVRAG